MSPARATLTSGTVRMVTPDMAVEDGTAELSAEPGESASRGTYTAVWIRQQGKWLLSSFREIGPRGPGDGAASLDELEWLAGRWQAEQKGNRVDLDCHWAPGKRFLLRDLQVTHNDGTIQHIHQRIGLAGSTGGIRSWSFDQDGGTAEGNWTKNGRDWLVTLNGVRSDGTVTSGRAIYSQIGSDQFDFETTDASVGGQPRPAVKLQFHRQAAPAVAGSATPRNPADQASRDKILASPAWRDTLAAFRDWISATVHARGTGPDESRVSAENRHAFGRAVARVSGRVAAQAASLEQSGLAKRRGNGWPRKWP